MLVAHMRARMHGPALGLLLVVATSVPALAQQTASSNAPSKTEYPSCVGKEVTKADSEAAHRKYLAGKDDYDEGKYDSAIRIFEDAYKKDCTKHELLVIISRAHELNHNLPEAVRALEVYLEHNPTSGEAQVHRNKIKNLQDRIAEERKKAAATPPPTSTAPSGGATPPPENQGHTIYPWLVVGAGVVTLAIGVVLLATVPALPAECNADNQTCNRLKDKDGNFIETQQQYEDRQADAGRHVNQPLIGGLVAGGGGLLIVGGLIWHFVEPTGPKDSAKTRVQPQLGPGYGGFSLTHRF
jgi:tetratricopeptide (TPR) repeat protein